MNTKVNTASRLRHRVKAPNGFRRAAEKDWERRTKTVCKPCWELKYCPYGPLVEQFPLPPIARSEMVAHNNELKAMLKKGIADPERRKLIREMISAFNPADYPEVPDRSEDDNACSVFGHYCPVFFVNEPFTETSDLRRMVVESPLGHDARGAS